MAPPDAAAGDRPVSKTCNVTLLRAGEGPPVTFTMELTQVQQSVLRLLGMPRTYDH
jgi:hypothetical protein